ncbi:hypothetical protein HKCCE2091_18380 [Rhodobacterales bacterium HKCCE2091]|nr:hypothetical protein [Rhodobacterales bacterium HKCCE2091]
MGAVAVDDRGNGGAVLAALLLCLFLGLAVSVAARLLSGDWLLLPAAGFALAAGVSVGALRLGWTAERLGPANALTFVRLALASLLLAPCARPDLLAGTTGWAIFALALVTLALDGVDGPLARRTGLAGRWGARFDMEVDAVFALLLAVVAWRSGTAGAWILLLGGMRYLFVLATLVIPWLAAPLPDRFRRKLVCVIQIGTLVALLAPVVGPPLSSLAAVAALLLLVWSFAVDVVDLAKRR